MRQTEFARVAAIHRAFRPAPGRGVATDMGPYHKPMKRKYAKAVRRLGKFLIHEAMDLDLETADTAPIVFRFQSPAYYCPECGVKYGDSRDMEDCSREHVNLRFEQSYFDWIEVEMAEDMLNWHPERACAEDARSL
tara:strand:- start:1968 stop:2375 length:408 start_codon:yes stop_codon:yes gene_type:complete